MAKLFGFAISDAALSFLESLPPKLRRQVTQKAKALMTEPHPPGSKLLRNLRDNDGERIYRERSGDYRILYLVRESPDEVVVLDIGNRKDIYK